MSQQKELAGLQFLRGFCAIAVVIDHVSSMAGEPKYFGKQLCGGLFEAGHAGVDIFFVISGFIITIVSLNPVNLLPKISQSTFLIKRFARIIPLMWLSILSYATFRLLGRSSNYEILPYIRAATLFPSGAVEPNIIWTLRHEFIFYVLFCLTFLRLSLMRYALLIWFLSPLFFITLNNGLVAVPDLSFGDIFFSTANLEFGSGFMLGLAWLKNRDAGIFAWRAHTIHVHPIIIILMATLATLTLSTLVPFPWRSIPTTLTLCLFGTIAVWIAVSIDCPEGRWTKLGVLLGDASYSIYLFHLHFSSALLGVISKHLPNISLLLAVTLIVIIATIASIMVHMFVERPLVRYVQSKLVSKSSDRPISVN